MKTRFPLTKLLPTLPDEMREAVEAYNLDADKVMVERKQTSRDRQKGVIDEENYAVEHYVHTRAVDRDGDLFVPGGWITKEFELYGSVLVGHNHAALPVATNLKEVGGWIKADDYGLRARTVFATAASGKDPEAAMVWERVKSRVVNSSSVGYVVLEAMFPEDPDFGATVRKLARQWGDDPAELAKARRIGKKVLLLEHSWVGVPSAPDANTKGAWDDDEPPTEDDPPKKDLTKDKKKPKPSMPLVSTVEVVGHADVLEAPAIADLGTVVAGCIDKSRGSL